MTGLWVVMPVYNEEDAIRPVVLEWLETLRSLQTTFTLCVLNDGSKDATLSILKTLADQHSEIRVIDKINSGHGQTCVDGYRLAVREGAQWIFQIDSDGQCDPRFFPWLWSLKEMHPFIFGVRHRRDDGVLRSAISRFLSGVVLLATRTWVKDPNVPYRLMNASRLQTILPKIPNNFDLANVLLSVLIVRQTPIRWVPIRFLKRRGGHSKSSASFFASKAIRLWKDLRVARVSSTDS